MLKTLIPTDTGGDSSSKQSPKDVDASNFNSCLECSQPNPRSAKKCQRCQKPLQGNTCLALNVANQTIRSWVPSCYKCGTTLPSYLGKTGKEIQVKLLIIN